jgi:DNA replication protein DnaC
MLKHPTLDLLGQLGLTGMAQAFTDLAANDEAVSLSHAEWLALLLDHEATYRNDRRLALRLRHARLRHHAVPEDVDYRAPRGLDRRLFDRLLSGAWIANHENLAVIGPTGIGKSWLACALGHQACRDNRSVLYTRLPRLLDELALAKGDGRIAARLKSLARVDLLILDDWGLEPLDGNARHHLLEILEDRYGQRSTLVTSQLPVANWHLLINDPTYADAILDRLVHNAHRIELSGESLRRPTAPVAP